MVETAVKKARQSNIELCRVLCMVLIIAHHCIVHGGAYKMDVCTNKWVSMLIIPGGKICYVAFLAISTWFLVEQNFKCERFIKIWGQTFFYSVTFTILAYISGIEITKIDFLSSFFPITGNVHGFAAAYLILYACIPFLSLVAKNINKKQHQLLLLILFSVDIFSQIMQAITGHDQKLYSNVGFFIFCYFLTLYLKRYPFKLLNSQLFLFTVFLICWLVIAGLYTVLYLHPDKKIFSILLQLVNSQHTINCVLAGYAMFFFFRNIKIPRISAINFLAKPTFAILMIHDHNFFRPVVWNTIIKANTWYYSKHFIVRVGLTVVFIYLVCTVIDYIRLYLIEKNIMKLKCIKRLEEKVDKVMNGSSGEKKAGIV